MQGFGRTLVTVLSVLLPGGVPAKADAPALEHLLEATIPDRMPADDVAGAVVVLIEGGAPVWTGTFGMADPGQF